MKTLTLNNTILWTKACLNNMFSSVRPENTHISETALILGGLYQGKKDQIAGVGQSRSGPDMKL